MIQEATNLSSRRGCRQTRAEACEKTMPWNSSVWEQMFRVNLIALVGNIETAFLNIEIHPEHRHCLRFLCLHDIHAENPEIITYRFNPFVFIGHW